MPALKLISPDEIEKAPARIQFLYIMALSKQPLGSKIINDAAKQYPEYFVSQSDTSQSPKKEAK
jgi:hypothetical protein